jgi:hypothetical protein
VTAAWLTSVFRCAGLLGQAAVLDFDIEPVGTGQMGDSFRFHLGCSEATDCPPSLVGKFTAADEHSRATGVSMRTAEVEVRFYQQVAPTLAARIPRCYHGDVDPATARFVLLLEDLAPLVPGDQLKGCSVDQAAAAVVELAKVHAPRWADPALARLEWLNRRDEQASVALAAIFPVLYDGFVERYSTQLPDPVTRVGDPFFPRIAEHFARRAGPRTVQHADYRVDNLLFGDVPGSPVAIVDWQTVTLGPGAADVSYFLGGSVEMDDRRQHEVDLLHEYHGALRAGGVDTYGWDELWRDYRRHAYDGLVMAVGAAMMVARTDRGDDMFMAMARRAAAHAEDMDSFALVGAE